MSGIFSHGREPGHPHGREPGRDSRPRRRGGLPAPFFPDARLAVWGVLSGYHDLAAWEPPGERQGRAEPQAASDHRPSLVRRMIARLRGRRVPSGANASGASPEGVGDRSEPSYIGTAVRALGEAGNDPGGAAGSPARAAA